MSKWISVDERLPETYEAVVCYAIYPTALEIGGFVTAGILHETQGFYVFNEDGEAETELMSVTHWMPLPEPPEAE